MHIPDGYIGPQTYGAGCALMVPIWALASRVLRRTLGRRQVPVLALGAAFSFLVMFLNVPVMGRLTAHPVGAALVAIVCGPWAACIGISAALAVQAVPFGDGGITTFGVNCLNLAVIAPFASWIAFRLLAGANASPRRLWLACAAAGYIGINAAAAAVGVEIGLQQTLAGPGMYLPYPVKTAVAVMLIPHLLIVGPIEGVITAAAIAYVRRTEPWLVPSGETSGPARRRLALLAALVVLLSPLGILVPRLFGAGPAWAEWGPADLNKLLGYIPEGIRRGWGFWQAPLRDYALPGTDAGPVWTILMAIVGGALTVGVGFALGRRLSRGGKDVSP